MDHIAECPHCRRKLKIALESADKAVRCPECKTSFRLPIPTAEVLPKIAPEKPATAPRSPGPPPLPPVSPRSTAMDDDDEIHSAIQAKEAMPLPRLNEGAGRSSRSQDDADAGQPRRRRSRRDDNDDDDFGERRRTGRRRANKSGAPLALALSIASVVCLAVIGIVLAVIVTQRELVPAPPMPIAAQQMPPGPPEPMKMPAKGEPKQVEGPLPNPPEPLQPQRVYCLAPPDSVFAAGIDVAAICKSLDIKQEIARARQGFLFWGARDLFDLIEDADRFVVAGTARFEVPVVIAALTTKKPYDPEKIKRLFQLNIPEVVRGRTIYRIPPEKPLDPDVFIAMPGPRVLAFGIMPRDDFLSALDRRVEVMPASLLGRAHALENKQAWGVLVNEGIIAQALRELKPGDLGQIAGAGQILDGLRKVNAVSMALELLPSKELQASLDFEFPAAFFASEWKKSLDARAPELIAALKTELTRGSDAAGLRSLFEEMRQSLQTKSLGKTASASMVIREKIWRGLEEPEKIAKEKFPDKTPPDKVPDKTPDKPVKNESPDEHQLKVIGTAIVNTGMRTPIQAIGYTPDGATFLTMHAPDQLRRWSMSPTRLEKTVVLAQKMPPGCTCAFAPDGKLLAVASKAGLSFFDTITGEEVSRHDEDLLINQLMIAFLPDGKRMVVAGLRVMLWDLAEKKMVWSRPGQGIVRSLAVSPDGKFLAGSSFNKLFVMDATTGTDLANFRPPDEFATKTGRMAVLGFTPDAQNLFVANGEDGSLRLWDWRARTQRLLLENTGKLAAKGAVHPGKNLLAYGMGGDAKIRFVDLRRGTQLGVIISPSSTDTRLAFAPNGDVLAVGGNGGVRFFPVKVAPSKDSELPVKIAPPPPPPPDPKLPPPESMPLPGPESRKPIVNLDMTPPVMKQERVTVPLPGAVSDLAVGGAGRFLILNFPARKKLGVFDVNEGKVIYYLDSPADHPLLAAGMKHLFVADPAKRQVDLWNLLTGSKQITFTSLDPRSFSGLAMGSASYGPLFVCLRDRDNPAAGTASLHELLTFRKMSPELDMKLQGDFTLPRAAANGLLFAAHRGGRTAPDDMAILAIDGSQAKISFKTMKTSILLPDPRANVLFGGTGIYHRVGKLMAPAEELPNLDRPFLPAHHGPFHVQLISMPATPGVGNVDISLGYKSTILHTLLGVEGVVAEAPYKAGSPPGVTHDQRIHLLPRANVLISIPTSNDRLILHRVDVESLLEKSKLNYLYVNSDPPRVAYKGLTYTYRLDVRSRQGGVEYRLESGPPGMEVSPVGVVTWVVPSDFTAPQSTALIVIRGRGNELRYSFTVRVAGK